MPTSCLSSNRGNDQGPGELGSGVAGSGVASGLKAVTVRVERRHTQSMLGGRSGHGW